MKSKRSRVFSWVTTILLILIIAACVWYLVMYFMNGHKEPAIAVPQVLAPAVTSPVDESDVTPQQKIEYKVPATHPRYISIPFLGIDKARVVPVGVYKGALDSPANINDAAWYMDSSTPGSGGVVVMDGHNGGTTKDGVFAKLYTLPVGSDITLERGDGQTFTYTVSENTSEPLDEVNSSGMSRLFETAKPGTEGLSLITCDGVYDKSVKQFNRRIMLRATLTTQS